MFVSRSLTSTWRSNKRASNLKSGRRDGASQVGDCCLTMTNLVWCKGRTTKANGIKITWTELAEILGSADTKKAALKAARVA